MKKIVFCAFIIMLALVGTGLAARQTVNNGETFGQARTKINDNFVQLYTGLQPGTLTYTANASPSAADLLANKYITNAGASGTITITLPAVSYEISRAVLVESAQIIQIAPPSEESFDLSGTTLTASQSFAGPATVGSKIVITRQRNAAGTWIWSADVVRGTWAGI